MAVETKKTEAPKGAESPTYTFVPVCRSEDLLEGEVRQMKARGKEIAVGRLAGGQVFAIGGRCTHLRARLGKGRLEGTILHCPWHGAQFDVTDGCVAKWVQQPAWLKLMYDATLPAFMKRGVPAYETKEENGEVFVAVD
ncbi:MAG: Rieske (2Fe-2S) protein [Dehalococcoidia bacterium]|nr:Rieske (2Fe-2S) protein [Dehalococcoidia bacterium]